jgi:hypothetical protein
MREEIRQGCVGTPRPTSSGYLATEKKLSAQMNRPLVIFGNQLARSAFDSSPPITSGAFERSTGR